MTDPDKLAREWLKRCAPNAEWGDDSALSVFAASVEDLTSLLARVEQEARADERERCAKVALEAADKPAWDAAKRIRALGREPEEI